MLLVWHGAGATPQRHKRRRVPKPPPPRKDDFVYDEFTKLPQWRLKDVTIREEK